MIGLSPPVVYRVHNSSITNLERGVMTRVLRYKGNAVVKPPEGIYRERLNYVRDFLIRCFPSTTPISQQQFVEYYRGRKRTVYQQAVDSLQLRSIGRQDAHVKAFVKAEFINFSAKPDPDPRIISPRDPRYNVEIGKYLRPIEHRLYLAVDKLFRSRTIFKGLNSKDVASEFNRKWGKFKTPVAVGLDASRFDQHVSKQALQWEHSIYNGIYKSTELQRLLRWQLVNKVKAYARDGKLKYTVEGGRMSGDMNTGLGNCVLMSSLVHSFAQTQGVNIELANNGDDCVVIMEACYLDKFTSGLTDWFLQMGFQMKQEKPVYVLEEIEFCQAHPCCIDGDWIMVRNFPNCLVKDCLSLKQFESLVVRKSWISAVSQGGLALAGGVPVIQSFYQALGRTAASIPAKVSQKHLELDGGLKYMSRGMDRKIKTVSQASRYSFYLAFGITPDQQENLEAYYDDYVPSLRVIELDDPELLPDWFSHN